MPVARENTNLQACLFGVTVAAFGVALLFLSAWLEETERLIRAAVARELGAFCIVTVIVTLIWELYAHRRIRDEVYEQVGMSSALASAGIVSATDDFSGPQVNFHSLIAETTKLDIFVAYGNTWRNRNAQSLRQMLARDGGRLRVALPNPDNVVVMSGLSDRFQQTVQALQQTIRAAADEYRTLSDRAGAVEIYFVDALPLFTFYLFENRSVIAFYNHRYGRLPVPSFVCTRDGWLTRYLKDEFASMMERPNVAA